MKTMLTALVAMALLLAACGSDDDTDDTASASEVAETETEAESQAEAAEPTTPVETPTEAPEPAAEAPADEDPPAAQDEPAAAQNAGFSMMNFRYCEILLTLTDETGTEVTEVWGTPGVDPCTDEAWYALDPDAIQAETGASFVRMNGPRYFVVDGSVDTGDGTGGTGTAAGGEPVIRQFGDVTMTLLATTEVTEESEPYAADLVVRTTTWAFQAGTEVYELTDPDGNVYTMQSYSLIEDTSLTPEDLPSLGDRLDLPEGWSYSSRVLDERLLVALSPDGAIVIQDELTNAYQRNG